MVRSTFNPQHLILLVGGAVLVITTLLLVVYLLQKSLGPAKSDDANAARVRVDDEAAFTLATVKGVLTQLKSEHAAAQEKLIAAERRADENARKFELLARESDFGVMFFDPQGFISFSNPLVRKILSVDTLSRRRYTEIFREMPVFSNLIGECVAAGTDIRNTAVEFGGADGSKREVEVSVLTTRDRSGALETIACIFRGSAQRENEG